MKTVIADIQDITDSFCSCIILIDRQKKEKKVLCSKFRNDCARIEDYDHYLPYELVATWDETIRNSSVIVKDGSIDSNKNLKYNESILYNRGEVIGATIGDDTYEVNSKGQLEKVN